MSAQRHELHLLTGSYALDALTDDEQADFEKHLARCPSCAEEVRGLREAAARLAMATAVTPPPEMRSRVLTAAPRTRQLPPPGRNLLARAGERTGPRRLSPSRAGLTAGVLTLAAAVAFLLVTQVSTSRSCSRHRRATARSPRFSPRRTRALSRCRRRSAARSPPSVAARARGGRHHGGPPVACRAQGLPALGHDRGGRRQVRRPAHDHQRRLGGAPSSPPASCRATGSGSPWSRRAGPRSRPRRRSSSCR